MWKYEFKCIEYIYTKLIYIYYMLYIYIYYTCYIYIYICANTLTESVWNLNVLDHINHVYVYSLHILIRCSGLQWGIIQNNPIHITHACTCMYMYIYSPHLSLLLQLLDTILPALRLRLNPQEMVVAGGQWSTASDPRHGPTGSDRDRVFSTPGHGWCLKKWSKSRIDYNIPSHFFKICIEHQTFGHIR